MKRIIDVMIPAYKPDEKLEKIICRLSRQVLPVRRVVIINTEKRYWDEARMAGVLKRCGREADWLTVRHIGENDFDHALTRYRGARLCMEADEKPDAILFMTQDAVPKDRHLTERLAGMLFSDDKIGGVYARQLPDADCHVIERYMRSFNYPAESRIKSLEDLPELGIKTFFCSDVCAMYRTEPYLEHAEKGKRTIFNEDMVLAAAMMRAGLKIGYCAGARVIHSHNYTPLQQLRRNFDLGVSQEQHPEVFAGISSEGEGIRLVKKTARFLLRRKLVHMLPGLLLQCAARYAGYRLGKKFRLLPRGLVRKISANRNYWRHFK